PRCLARLAQPERRLPGGRPDRGPVPGSHGRRAADCRGRPADRRRSDDQWRVDAIRAIGRGSGLMAKVDEPAPGLSAGDEDEAGPSAEDLSVSPELVSGSVSEYLRMSFARIRGGDTGVLPVVAGLLLVSIVFQSQNAHFLTAANLVNLLVQA